MKKVVLNKEIYDGDSIREAIIAFSRIINVVLDDCNDYYRLSFSNSVLDIDNAVDEFCNYILGLSIKKKGILYD